MIIGFGVALYIVGTRLTTPEFPISTGWVGYAPLTSSIGRARLSRDADLILWLVLIALWVIPSSYLLRTRAADHDQN